MERSLQFLKQIITCKTLAVGATGAGFTLPGRSGRSSSNPGRRPQLNTKSMEFNHQPHDDDQCKDNCWFSNKSSHAKHLWEDSRIGRSGRRFGRSGRRIGRSGRSSSVPGRKPSLTTKSMEFNHNPLDDDQWKDHCSF